MFSATQEIRDQCNPDSTVGPGFEKAFSAHEEAVSSGDLAEAPKITVKVNYIISCLTTEHTLSVSNE